ncbi:MAG: hypothetical protein JXA94_02745 [Parachlamydiales bacterium]|nr:hypothetical protein [Parachlamydiales bacterium]
MLKKRILGIVIIIIGAALIISSFIIKSQVSEGRKEIAEAQKQVNRGSSLFSHNPITKEIGKGLTGAAQNKIDAGTQKANFYNTLAVWFQIGGAVFIVLGAGIIFIGRKK